MLIGAMNHPARPLEEQIAWLRDSGFEFIDLTLEAPCAASWNIDVEGVHGMLARARMKVVGHTAPFLPFFSAVEELRQAALVECRRCIDVLARLGAQWMNVHPGLTPMHSREFAVRRNVESLAELILYGRERGVGVMVENVPGRFNTAAELGQLLDRLPELGLHLDVGHANLMATENMTGKILERFGDRLRHVHLHDNRGGALDLHLPLGAGSVDVAEAVRSLKASGYDGTITLEVFSEDRNLLLHSRDVLRKIWDQVGTAEREHSTRA
jgi:sugar phosphate isomerase/epimerase